jgi:hypothetical protein
MRESRACAARAFVFRFMPFRRSLLAVYVPLICRSFAVYP